MALYYDAQSPTSQEHQTNDHQQKYAKSVSILTGLWGWDLQMEKFPPGTLTVNWESAFFGSTGSLSER